MKTKKKKPGLCERSRRKAAKEQEQDDRTDHEQIDEVTMPRAVTRQDRVGEMIILADGKLIGRAQGFEAASEENEHDHTE